MTEALIMVGVAAMAFVSANLDNLFLLIALLAGSGLTTRDATIGYVAAVGVVLAATVAGSYAFDLADAGWLRYLGLVPLGMGLWRLRSLAGAAPAPAADDVGASATSVRGIAAVFVVMLGASGDSAAVFMSLMGETAQPLVFVIAATAIAMAASWAALARWVSAHPALAPRLRSIDRILVPILLVTIGLYILADTATDGV